MMNYNILGIDIEIKLESGIYLMDNESAVGKTRLGKLLLAIFNDNQEVYYYSIEDFRKGLKVNDILKNSNIRVMLIDRLDLFIDDYNIFEEILEYSNQIVFLLDLKNKITDLSGNRWCNVRMTENKIEVY